MHLFLCRQAQKKMTQLATIRNETVYIYIQLMNSTAAATQVLFILLLYLEFAKTVRTSRAREYFATKHSVKQDYFSLRVVMSFPQCRLCLLY